jgi:aminopeptidase N
MTRSTWMLGALVGISASIGGACWEQGARGPARAGNPSIMSRAQAPLDDLPATERERLPAKAVPRHYALEIQVDPTKPRFAGRATIVIELAEPSSVLVLHAREMNIAHVVAHVGRREFAGLPELRSMRQGPALDQLTLRFSAPLPAGLVRLVIDYDAPFASDLSGLYRVRERDLDYAFTQFEPTDARRAFPCFDEPGYKTPFDLVLVTPPEMTALANAPEASSSVLPDGSIAHRFLTTAPLPTYLVAFAVGVFDIVQGRSAPFPIRVVAPKGEGSLARSALETAAALVDRLADYIGISYPYDKMDLVAVPDCAAGGMENPGLITFRADLLLIDPARASTRVRRSQAAVLAHELAHQWFGDLVTMRWWDDLWLSEGFATWAQAKIVDEWQPRFGAGLDQISSVDSVMDVDALAHARSVREPVRSRSEAAEAFNKITYQKGAAVLRMIEHWMGPEIFRRGVQKYLRDHAWQTAGAGDLFAALDYVSTFSVGRMASGFLDHPGVPEVRVNWKCGARGRSTLTLSVFDWRSIGAVPETPGRWTVPVCVNDTTGHSDSCFTLGSEPVIRELGTRCPAWVYPNADQSGYYRFTLGASQLLALAEDERALSPADRAGLIANAWAEVRSGHISPATLLNLLARFDGDDHPAVVEQVVRALSGIDRALVEDAARPAFERFVRARLGPRKAALGWTPAPRSRDGRDDDDRAIARRVVLSAMGEIARDADTIARADAYAVRWLEEPSSVPSDTADVAVPIASIGSGAVRLQQLRIAAQRATTLEARELALRAMGAFVDPTVLRQALDLVLTPEIRTSEIRHLFGSALGSRARRTVVLAWEKDHWADLLRRAPGVLGRRFLVDAVGSMCDAQDIEYATAFLETEAVDLEGIRRGLDDAIESAQLCMALHAGGAASLTKSLGP